MGRTEAGRPPRTLWCLARRVLRDVARADAQTGAETELDLQAMETMSSIRLNAMGILGYWRRRRAADGAGQAS